MRHGIKKTGSGVAAFLAAMICLPMPSAHATGMIRDQFDMQDATGRTLRIFTAHPAGKSPAEGWPVIWLTDGNMTFPLAMREKPQALLVGIGYPLQKRSQIITQRYFDLTTPASVEAIPLQPGQPVPQTGGSAMHLHFILEKLRPLVDARFPVNKDRQTLYGHSLGGLFVIHALLNSRQSFQTYCAADPAIWWNGHEIMAELAALKTGAWYQPSTRVRITVSGKKANHPGLSGEDAAKIARLRNGPNGRVVFDTLRQTKNIEADFRAYKQETHGSLVAVSLRDCLSFSAVLSSSSRHSDTHNHVNEVKHEKPS